MTIQFNKKEEWFQFYDSKGTLIERKTEIRFDPLTGESARVYEMTLGTTPPDYTEVAKQTGGKNCPFCPENRMTMTPVFPKEITDKGRIIQGEAIAFPNLFPYSKHNAVVLFSDQHYVRLEDFTIEMMSNAFKVAQTYIQQVNKTDPTARYASINWNYLPQSGGSILHPHLHIIVSDMPTNYQDKIAKQADTYKQNTKKDYFIDLYTIEKSNGERWIGEKGSVAWVHAFAPKSHNDFIGIFKNARTIDEISIQDWSNFSEGLKNLFSVLLIQGFTSFNLALHVSIDSNEKHPIHVRLIPRLTIGGLDTSDINFFQSLHQEPLSYTAPEMVAEKARLHF